MNVQYIIDRYITEAGLSTVLDIVFIKDEGVLCVRRKKGHRPVLIDISRNNTEESLINRLKTHPAVY